MDKEEIEILNTGPSLRLVSQHPNRDMYYGFPYGGAMDYKSAQIACEVLGTEDRQVIECSLKGCKLRFLTSVNICITGADMAWELDGELIELNTKLEVKADQVLKGGFSKNGLRSYIAFSKNMIRRLDNKLILSKENPIDFSKKEEVSILQLNNELEIKRGPEWNMLTQEAKERMMSYESTITQDISRMGVYLKGESIDIEIPFPKKSVCTFPGVIQLLPSGQVLVLCQDAQTTGGYPRIAYLDKENLCDFNQLSMGHKIKWRLIK